MGGRSFITKLSVEERERVNRMVRENSYGNLDEVVRRLEEQGVYASRSAVGRHAQALRHADSSLGDPDARVVELKATRRSGSAALLAELMRLQTEQARILRELQACTESGTADAGEPSLGS